MIGAERDLTVGAGRARRDRGTRAVVRARRIAWPGISDASSDLKLTEPRRLCDDGHTRAAFKTMSPSGTVTTPFDSLPCVVETNVIPAGRVT